MAGSFLALVVALIGLVTTVVWFGARRRKVETQYGIQSLANMKWRDCMAVVLQALQREGYEPVADSLNSGDGGTEFLLTQGSEKVLLGYKHGTAYHLGVANVHEFANALRMQGAQRGIVLTLGSTEINARTVAGLSNIQLIDGEALWPKVRPFIPPHVLHSLSGEAAARTRKGLWTGVFASALAGVAAFLFSNSEALQAAPAAVAAVPAQWTSAAPASVVPVSRSDEATLKQLNDTARAMAEVAKLSNEQLAQRRVDAAKQVAQLGQIDTAAWSAQRTLLVTLNRTDGKDKVLVAEMCRILTQYEEMRFTRVQLEPPADSDRAVRWRLCE